MAKQERDASDSDSGNLDGGVDIEFGGDAWPLSVDDEDADPPMEDDDGSEDKPSDLIDDEKLALCIPVTAYNENCSSEENMLNLMNMNFDRISQCIQSRCDL